MRKAMCASGDRQDPVRQDQAEGMLHLSKETAGIREAPNSQTFCSFD